MNKVSQIYEKTIAAIATPPGYGGISVIRISGQSAFKIADRLLGENTENTAERRHGTFFHTTIYDPESGECLDDALVLVFHAPKSYTGENTVEIQGHGGFVPAKRLLNAALKAGAKLAEPGEFTKRAFLNGKMDLTQAEAVCDLIQSQTERAAALARTQLDGLLGHNIHALYDEIVDISSGLEYLLDFDEIEIADNFLDNSVSRIKELQKSIENITSTWHDGELLRQGVMIVLSGPPNAGKSSLLNTLLKRNRAIVHNTPGTTRDVIEESYSLKGVPVRLVDTAGLRKSGNEIECEGIRRAYALIEQADLNLLVVDKTQCSADSIALLLKEFDLLKLILVFNKNDISGAIEFDRPENVPVVDISALTGEGLSQLKKMMTENLGIKDAINTQPVVTQRHLQELKFTEKSLDNALDVLKSEPNDIVIVASCLREGSEALGRIIGKTYSDDLLDNIFSNFCVGK
jgi:tRNA modification GTPase